MSQTDQCDRQELDSLQSEAKPTVGHRVGAHTSQQGLHTDFSISIISWDALGLLNHLAELTTVG